MPDHFSFQNQHTDLTAEGGAFGSHAPIHPQQLTGERIQLLKLGMHTGGQGGKVGIVRADDDSGMIGVLAVEADEVLAVMCEDGAAIFDGITQNLVIGDASVRFASVVSGLYIIPEPTKLLDNREREVFV